MGRFAAKSLLEHVLAGTFRYDRQAGLLASDELPAIPPTPRVADEWAELRALTIDYRRAKADRDRRSAARRFQEIAAAVHRRQREAESLAELISARVGPHPVELARRGRKVSPNAGANRFFRFAERFLVHTKGRWAGQPVVFYPRQRRKFAELLRVDPATGLRVKREAYWQQCKKNGKSTSAVALGLYLLTADEEPEPEGYNAAGSKDQARVIFRQASTMGEKSKLAPFLNITRNAIEVPETGGFWLVVAADADLLEGPNPHFAIADEVHRHKRRDLYDVLARGGIARLQPLTFAISNAGADAEDDQAIWAELRSRVLEALADPELEPELHGWVDEVGDDELENRRAWLRVNPAPWITAEVLERERRRMKRAPWLFERFHMNRPVQAEAAFVTAEDWDRLANGAEVERGDDAFAGVDFGQKSDTAAAALVFPRGDGFYAIRAHSWAVEPGDGERRKPAHEYREGKVRHRDVEAWIRSTARDFSLQAAGYDPWRFGPSADDLEAEGLTMIEIPQTNERMVRATELLRRMIDEGRLIHDGDEILRRQILNATVREVSSQPGALRLDKRETRAPMDLAVAVALAIYTAEELGPEPAGTFGIYTLGEDPDDDDDEG